MAKLKLLFLLATFVVFANCNRLPRNSLNKAPQIVNDKNKPQIGADDSVNQPLSPKVAAAETKMDAPKVVNSQKLIEKTVVIKETPESSSESNESLFSSAAGLISGVLNSGRRNLDVIKSVPVMGNAVPMVDPLINEASKIVQRSVDNASEANLVELRDLYNRTNYMVKINNEQYNALARSEEDNNNIHKYTDSVLKHFNFQRIKYTYKTNSSDIAFTEAMKDLQRRKNYTAVQFAAPLIKALIVEQSIISLPVEIIHTVCKIDTPDEECIEKVVTLVNKANTAECGDRTKFQIFKLVLQNISDKAKLEAVHQTIVTKVKAKVAATRRKRDSNLAANNMQSNVAELDDEEINLPMAVNRIRRNIGGNNLQANAPTGLINNKVAVNTDTKPLAGSIKANVNDKPNLTPNQALNNAKPYVAPNQSLVNVGIVPGIPATNTNVVNQNDETRRMNNLETNKAQNVPDNNVNIKLGSRRMNNVGAGDKPVDVVTNDNQAAPLSNLASPSRRSNREDFSHVFDIIVSELNAAHNAGEMEGGCKIFEAIADAQKVHPLCNVFLLDKVLDNTP